MVADQPVLDNAPQAGFRLSKEVELQEQTQPEKHHPGPGDLAVGRANLWMPVPGQRPAAGHIARVGHDGTADKDAAQSWRSFTAPISQATFTRMDRKARDGSLDLGVKIP